MIVEVDFFMLTKVIAQRICAVTDYKELEIISLTRCFQTVVCVCECAWWTLGFSHWFRPYDSSVRGLQLSFGWRIRFLTRIACRIKTSVKKHPFVVGVFCFLWVTEENLLGILVICNLDEEK